MSEYKAGFGIILGGLIKLFDCRHLLAAFGVFETIGHQDDPPVEEANPWKTLEDQPGPEVGQVVQTHRLTVKECQEALIIALLETQGTDHAAHAHGRKPKCLERKPDAGNPHVRFDERDLET